MSHRAVRLRRCMSGHPALQVGRLVIFAALLFSLNANLSAQTRHALLIGIDHYAPPAGAASTVPSAGHAPDSRFAPGASWINLQGPGVDIANVKVLLAENFGFKDIRVLSDQQATRQGILTAIDQLVADTRSGDLDVIYYAGHGSRRLDTLSSKSHFDETIVPADAWKGTGDIRDKELAVRFDRIVYDKHAHLTAIFDSCNSGTMARGITDSVQRVLPYDDRDVAAEKKKDPTTVVEADLKQIPQNGDAIILAAAASDEPAAEAKYSDDQWHGAFSRALVHVLQSSTQTLSVADVVAEVSNMMHADRVPFQQPSVEGRTQQSLFGDPVAAHALHVRVSGVSPADLKLDLGSAAGFDTGTQFTAIEPGPDGRKAVIEVLRIDEPLVSIARIVGAPATVKVGQVFELTKMVYPKEARLTIFASLPVPDASQAALDAKSLFPGLTWVEDPAVDHIDFLVVKGDAGWVAYNQAGEIVAPGPIPKGAAFLALGPPSSVRDAIEHSLPFQRNAFSFTQRLAEANYVLALRQKSGTAQYAFFDPVVLAPHPPDRWVRSAEDDPGEAALNGGVPPEVVCRNDVSLPVRTAWMSDSGQTANSLVLALNRRIARLGKLRLWLQSPALAPGTAGWPYHPVITQHNSDVPISAILHPQQQYDVRLVTTAEQRAAHNPIPRYVYLFGFDCAANPYLLYPPENLNGVATVPQPGPGGVYPLSVALGVQEEVGLPLGADTLFLMVTSEKLTQPGVLVMDGVLDAGARGGGGRFDELIADMSSAGTRGPVAIPTNWWIQQLVLPSRP
jgi:hypothetical protein